MAAIENGIQSTSLAEDEDYFFDGSNVEAWSDFLKTNGYCVIRSLAHEEIEATKEHIWNNIQQSFDGVEKNDVNTWGKIPNGTAGIMSTCLPQTQGPWLVRSLESIRSIFANIWKTDELLVSMDSVLLWLPWWYNRDWTPFSEGLHLDQNPYHKPDRCCVQGMVPLIDVTDISGGLEVVPLSHTVDAQTQYKELHPNWQRNMSDWCVIRNKPPSLLPADAPINDNKSTFHKPRLLKAKAGDLILWDSRLVHGGRVGNGNRPSTASTSEVTDVGDVELARLAIPICMTPRSFASKKVLEIRQRGFNNGNTFTHWPHEAVITNRLSHTEGHVPIELSERAKELI